MYEVGSEIQFHSQFQWSSITRLQFYSGTFPWFHSLSLKAEHLIKKEDNSIESYNTELKMPESQPSCNRFFSSSSSSSLHQQDPFRSFTKNLKTSFSGLS